MQSALINEIMLIVSFLGSNVHFFGIFILSIGAFLMLKNKVNEAFFLFLTPVSYLYSVLLKGIFKIPRPKSTPNLKLHFPADIYGLPSSHTVIYTVFFGYLLHLTYNNTQEASLSVWLVRLVCCAFILLVGPSRVCLGLHSIKDVVAGYFFGGLFLAGLIFLKTYKR